MAELRKNETLRQLSGPDGTLYTIRKYTYDGRVIPGQDVDTLYGIETMGRDQVFGRSIGLQYEADIDRVLHGSGDVDIDTFDPMGQPKKVTLAGFGLPGADGRPVTADKPAAAGAEVPPVSGHPAESSHPQGV